MYIVQWLLILVFFYIWYATSTSFSMLPTNHMVLKISSITALCHPSLLAANHTAVDRWWNGHYLSAIVTFPTTIRRRIQWQGLSKWIKRIVEIADLPRRLCLLLQCVLDWMSSSPRSLSPNTTIVICTEIIQLTKKFLPATQNFKLSFM